MLWWENNILRLVETAISGCFEEMNISKVSLRRKWYFLVNFTRDSYLLKYKFILKSSWKCCFCLKNLKIWISLQSNLKMEFKPQSNLRIWFSPKSNQNISYSFQTDLKHVLLLKITLLEPKDMIPPPKSNREIWSSPHYWKCSFHRLRIRFFFKAI